MNNIKISKNFINLIKMQRPYIQGITDEEIFYNYMKDIEDDYKDIKDFIIGPDIVDIGAGMGGIDFLIKKQHNFFNITMLDGEEVEDGEHYGFKEDLKFYSNNKIAKQFFDENDIDANFLKADDTILIKCNTLISLNSWGFHYPLNRYTLFVKNNRPQVIIIDIRPKYQNITELENLGYKFHKVLRRWGTKKSRIVLFDPLTHVGPTSSTA